MKLSVTVERNPKCWETLQAEWQALLERASGATIFQTWEWNQIWWSCFGKNKNLYLVLVRLDGKLIGLAPLYVRRHFYTPLRRLAFVGTYAVKCAGDYFDFIADDSHRLQVGEAILRYLAMIGSKDFDVIDLQQLRSDALPIDVVGRKMEVDPCRFFQFEQKVCPYLLLESALPESKTAAR